MTGSLSLLRRLVDMRQFEALREACYNLPVISPAEQVLLALARLIWASQRRRARRWRC
jgi:hypothetical protein